MTAPRTGLFQRKGTAPKGAPVQTGNTPDGPGDQAKDPAPETGEEGDEGPEPVTCPQCGCQFDASDPSVQGDGAAAAQPSMGSAMDDGSGGDLGAKIAALMQGGGGHAQ
jgi:hypothetical protein